MRPRLTRRALLPALALALLTLAAPNPAASQSFLGFRALGVPIATAGGRSLALGNFGIGLPNAAVSPMDPAAAAGIALPTITVSMQPSWGDFQFGSQSGETRTTRFPLIAIGYPARGGVVTVSFAGHMEQRWRGTRTQIEPIDGVDVPIEDSFETEGGTSVARLGWAQRLGNQLSVGVSAGLYVGRLDQVFDRRLDSLVVGNEVRPYTESAQWAYGGYTVAAGFGFDPHELIHLGGALEWSSDLSETPEEGTEGAVTHYGIPLRLSAGATGSLTQRLSLNTSAVYQDWTGAKGFATGVTTNRKLSWGAGIEWRAMQQETRSFPVRVGYRSGAPPFRFESQDPTETSWSFGLGLNLVELEGAPFGWIDLGMERATRTSLPFNENFWRGTISLGISRF